MSLRQILTLIVLLGSLVPSYLVGTQLIDRHSQHLMQQKQLKLESSIDGIEQSVKQELTNIANLTNWYSRDRLLIMGSENILYSAIVAQKLEQFNQLADPITTTFVLDKEWNPIYESNGSLFHLEQSELLDTIKSQQEVYYQGSTFHTEYQDEQLVASGGQQGIALITPLLSYTLLPGSDYEPKGYLLVLVSYDDLIALSRPYLFEEESVAVRYLNHSLSLIDEKGSQLLKAEHFYSPLYFAIDHRFSDRAREQELKESQSQLNSAMLIILVATLGFGVVISQWMIRPIRELEGVVRRYQEGTAPDMVKRGFQFREFKQVLSLTEELWQRVVLQMRVLESQNVELQQAHNEVKQSNAQLAHFNQDLERKVDAKTIELRNLLTREEQYQHKLVQVIDFFSNRSGVTYRTIPSVCNRFLAQLCPSESIRFSFERPLDINAEAVRSIDGRILGYICLNRKGLDEQQAMLLAVFVKQLASWLELETMARWDKLCDILNRKAFEEDLEDHRINLRNETLNSLSLVMIDINGLKPLNDSYGHDKGDLLLQCTVGLIHPLLDANDALYRVGGDEFVLLMRNASSDALNLRVEALKALKGQQHIALPDGERHLITYSVGAASTLESDIDRLYRMADKDMYHDKREHYLYSASATASS